MRLTLVVVLLPRLVFADTSQPTLSDSGAAIPAHRLKGPYPSLDAWCSAARAEWESSAPPCETTIPVERCGAPPPLVLSGALAEVRVVSSTGGRSCDLAVRTARGWYVYGELGWNG